jgi:MFS family permease
LLTTFLFQILVVHAAGRVAYKSMLLLSFLGISASLLLIPFSNTYLSLFLFYILFRVFDSFYHTMGIAWVSRTHPSQGIDFAMGVQSGSGNLGVVLAFVSVGFLGQRFSWHFPLYVWSAGCFLLGLVSYFLVKPVSFPAESSDRLNFSSWLQTISQIRRYVAGFLFGGASWAVTVYFAPSLLHHKFSVPMGRTGIFLAVWIGIGTVMTYLFGRLSSRFGRLALFRAAFIGASLSLLLIGLARRSGLAVAGLMVFGLFLFLIYPALQSFVGNAVPSAGQAQAFSFVSNLSMISGALISLLAGFLSDSFGISSPFLVLGVLGLGIFCYSSFSSARSGASR